jgi:hypothetical protein
MRDQGERRSRAADLCLGVGAVFLLAYALPLFAPPSALPVALPPPGTTAMARMFPHVPAWWMTARLIALFIGALLVAAATTRSALPGATPVPEPDTEGSSVDPWFAGAALVAALMHVGCLPWIAQLPPIGQLLYVVWLAVPGGLLVLGVHRHRRSADAAGRRWMGVALLIAFWVITRLWIGWHSPRVANVVDMWRTFAGLVHMTAAHQNLLSNSIDPEIPGVN